MKIDNAQILKVLEFVKLLNDFKSIERMSLIKESGRRESDAEHTWHLTMAVWLFSSVYDKKIDLLKCMKLALVHDLVELYAGDVYAYDTSHKRDEKEVKETQAIQKLKEQLSDSLGEEVKALWDEYEKRESEEGKFVWAMDKFMPRMQYILTKGDCSDTIATDPSKRDFQEEQMEKVSDVVKVLLDAIK